MTDFALIALSQPILQCIAMVVWILKKLFPFCKLITIHLDFNYYRAQNTFEAVEADLSVITLLMVRETLVRITIPRLRGPVWTF